MEQGSRVSNATTKGGRKMRELRCADSRDRSTRRLAALGLAIILAPFLNGCKEDDR
jgi:hypothetical protein